MYSRKQGDASHRWQKVNEERNPQVYSRRQHHVQGEQPTQMQGEQQGSNASSVDTEDLPIALRKGTREKAGIPGPKYGFDANDIGNYVSMKHYLQSTNNLLLLFSWCLFQLIGRQQKWIQSGEQL